MGKGRWRALWWLLAGPPGDPAAIRRFQSDQLRRLVRHAYGRVPWYRRLLDAHNVRPESIRGIEDLHRLPITTKEELAGLPPGERIARGLRLLPPRRRVTTGSTGIPLQVSTSQFEDRFLAAHRIRRLLRWGWQPWRTQARIRVLGPHLRLPITSWCPWIIRTGSPGFSCTNRRWMSWSCT